jgi:predicted SAM-dependent methyltransferase
MRLNFGCGSIQPADWINLDSEDFGQSHLGSVGERGYRDEIDIIVAHCSLQMNTYNKVPRVLRDLYHALKTGGVLRISLPDIHAGFTAWESGNIDWFPNSEPNLDDRFSNWLTWYSTTRSLWTIGAISNRLYEAGFVKVELCEFGQSGVAGAEALDTREGECFFVEALK